MKHFFTLTPTIQTYRFDDLTSLNDLRLHKEPMPQPQRCEFLFSI